MKSDIVPCFYTSQDDAWQEPAEEVSRDIAREYKAQGLGKFENHGRTFRFSQAVTDAATSFWDGPFGIGNILPFYKIQSKLKAPEKLHYPIPACGAHGRFLRVADINQDRTAFPPLPA